MRVRCIALIPNERQALQLRKNYTHGRQEFHIILGKEYIVFGIRILGGAPWVDIVTDSGYLYPVPLCLFEITDGRVSQYWELHFYEDGDLTLWPPSFYKEYYHDDLIEGVYEVVEDFDRVRTLIEAEAQPKPN
jgi:hypothetical protein